MVQLTICQHWLMLQNFVFGGRACFFLVPQNNIITVRCHYNTVRFLSNTHKRHPVAHPSFVSWKSDLCSVTHYNDVIMGALVSQITSLTIVYSTVYSGTDQRKHISSASLAFVQGIHRGAVNSLHKWPVTRKMFPFDDVIMVIVVRIYWCE